MADITPARISAAEVDAGDDRARMLGHLAGLYRRRCEHRYTHVGDK